MPYSKQQITEAEANKETSDLNNTIGFLREGNSNPLQYSCVENPMDGGAWQAAVYGVTRSQTQLSDFTFTLWRRKQQPTPVFLPGESQGRGSLVGGCLWGRTESDMTEATQHQQQQQHRVSQVILVVMNPLANARDVTDACSVPGSGGSPGGGHSNALQYSCLENPMDRRTWWAMVHRVTESQT